MAQISRPFQIGLLAVVLLAGVWLFALRGRSTSSESAPATSASASQSSGQSQAASTVYHGAAPGVAGLTRAILKAHEAVGTSTQNAQALEQKAAQASSATPTGSAAPSSSSSTAVKPTPRTPATKHTSTQLAAPPAASPPKAGVAPKSPARPGVPSRQRAVEADLARGEVVALLFWDSKSPNDVAVRQELQLLLKVHKNLAPLARNAKAQRLLKVFGLELSKPIAVQEASAKEVASFGSITRGVQVDGTPTIVILGKHGQTTTLTGLQDAYSIEQAMDETRKA